MIVSECLSIKLSQILQNDEDNRLEQDDNSNSVIQAQQQWNAAIVAIQKLLSKTINTEKINPEIKQAVVISSPTPIINDIKLVSQLETVVFSSPIKTNKALMPCEDNSYQNHSLSPSSFINISLESDDILREEQFCLVFTDTFACVIVKTENENQDNQFYFSFSPETVNKAWYLLKARLIRDNDRNLNYIQKLVSKFSPCIPCYKIVSQFTTHLLKALKQSESTSEFSSKSNQETKVKNHSISLKKTPLPPYPELELLQALTHEIRTPLATIKTTTRLLKRKAKLSEDLTKYLDNIEQECNEQINRMELIFQAVEFESKPNHKPTVHLVNTCLENILNQSIAQWKKQAQRRNIVLDIVIPKKLPQIVSEPKILSQALGGLMERFIRNSPSGGDFKVVILPVGNQLKLQFLSEFNFYQSGNRKCLGKLLLFQPETGNLSLSNDVTKNLFQTLGGKLTIKQKPDQGEVLTIFLPLNNHKSKKNHKLGYKTSNN